MIQLCTGKFTTKMPLFIKIKYKYKYIITKSWNTRHNKHCFQTVAFQHAFKIYKEKFCDHGHKNAVCKQISGFSSVITSNKPNYKSGNV